MKKILLTLSFTLSVGLVSAQSGNSTVKTDKTTSSEVMVDTATVAKQLEKESKIESMDAVKTKDHVKTTKAPSSDSIKNKSTVTRTKKKTQHTTTR